VRHKYLLDKPIPVQYAHWIWLAVHGDLGVDQRELPVAHTIVTRLPITLELAFLSMFVGILIGIPAGVIAAVRRGKPSDYAVTAVSLVGLSVPHFWLGLLLIVWFAVDLQWLPASGYVTMHHPVANLEHMLLPCLVLGAGLAAVLMRQTRSSMLTALGGDYVRTARAKGLSESTVVGRHALRNSLITVTTVIGLQLGALISGAVITETIFGIAGFGRLTIEAVQQRDYTLIQGVVLVSAAGYVVINLLVDVVYSLLNPRIRVAGGRT
jgi:peptide/nickel transport system permease protein